MERDLVTVGDFEFVSEAEAARLHLAEEGIPAFLSDREIVAMDWLLGNAIGYVKLQVPDDQAQAALDTLGGSAAPARREFETSAPEAAACLACGAELTSGQASCPACGWSYAADRPEVDDDLTEDLIEAPEAAAGFNVMDMMRALKRPFFVFLLLPVFSFAGAFWLALAILAWLVDVVFP